MRLANELEELIRREDPETVAAFIAEPVMGAGGVIVPPQTYFREVMKVCRRYDVYMIADEVICGFGRLGTMFGCTALGFEPELHHGGEGVDLGLRAHGGRDGAGADVSGYAG